MNKHKLMELADHIENLPHEKGWGYGHQSYPIAHCGRSDRKGNLSRFNMAHWLTNDGKCGCIAGWTCELYGWGDDPLASIKDQADSHIGLSYDRNLDYIRNFFQPNMKLAEITPKQAARFLRIMAEDENTDPFKAWQQAISDA